MTTIAYDQPIVDLIDALSATGHVTHSRWKKKSVTFHHNGGRLSHQGVLNVWKVRPASAQFDSDAFGRIAQYTEVYEYAWACGNTLGNQESISIEMCNSTLSPGWNVAEVTLKSAARLAGWLFVHVIKAEPTRENVHFHHDWLATACAGPYMDSVYDKLLAEVQKAYRVFKGGDKPPAPLPPTPVGPTRFYVGQKVQKAWAKLERTKADGVISSQDSGNRACVWPELWPCIDWDAPGKARGSQLIVAYQKRRHLRPDGLLGPNTAGDIQDWLGVRRDRILGPESTQALCEKLKVA